MMTDKLPTTRAYSSNSEAKRVAPVRQPGLFANALLFVKTMVQRITDQPRSAVIGWIDRQRTRLTRDPARVAALKSAATIITKRYPEWHDAYFDMHFIHHRAAPLLEPFLHGEDAPSPQAIAELWCEQFYCLRKNRAATVARVLPIANDFVYVLQSELAFLETGDAYIAPGRSTNEQKPT